MGIAYHPNFEYVAPEVNGEVYIVALELLKATAEKAGWPDRHPRFQVFRTPWNQGVGPPWPLGLILSLKTGTIS